MNCPDMLLHDIIQLLYEKQCKSDDMQEEIIKRYTNSNDICELEKIMEQYGTDYKCDFRDLQLRVKKDLDNEFFQKK